MEPYFQWEMCVNPPSLFKENFMRKSVKSDLADALYKGVAHCSPSDERMRIVDGGWLLHYIRWQHKTYQEIFGQYSAFLERQFGQCIVIFDGYPELTTKDHEHQRRKSNRLPAATIDLNPSRNRYKNQEALFLLTLQTNLASLLCSQITCKERAYRQAITGRCRYYDQYCIRLCQKPADC